MQNANDAVRNKHLEALADAAKNFTLNELAALTLSGGASSYSDSSFTAGVEFADAVLNGVGGLFVPSVSSVADFLANDDSNIQFFDNRLKDIIEGKRNSFRPESGNPYYFRGGEACVQLDSEYGEYAKFSLTSDNNSVSLLSDNSTREMDYVSSAIYKLSETAGFVIQEIDTIKSGSSYDSTASFISFKVTSDNKVATVSSASVCPAASTTPTVYGSNSYDWIASICDPNHFIIVNEVNADNSLGTSHTYKYNTQRIDPVTGAITTTKTNTSIGVNYNYTKTSSTVLADGPYIHLPFPPKFTFSGASCTVATALLRDKLPFVPYETNVISSSGAVTGGGKYVLIHHGANEASPVSTLQLTTLSGGVTSTLNDWLEDDNNLIAGIWQSRSSSNIYAVTFKKGTYSTDSPTWFDNCSSVWLFDFLTPKLFKTTTKLSEILNDLLI